MYVKAPEILHLEGLLCTEFRVLVSGGGERENLDRL